MARFTPGPWKTNERRLLNNRTGKWGPRVPIVTTDMIENGPEATIAKTVVGEIAAGYREGAEKYTLHRVTAKEARANAKLMAAAPDLLHLAKRMVKESDVALGKRGRSDTAREIVRLARKLER